MDIDKLVHSLPRETYERLLTAVETGRWPDGNLVTEEQRENSMQLVMLYQAKVLQSEEHMTVGKEGEIVQKSRSELQQDFASQPTIARFKQDDI